uniref:Ephrin_rec_like domain-containing protein n=1 Tax=Macrostomum lignano TaxID=282301 RepID=A0A1I8IEC9_9PLAT
MQALLCLFAIFAAASCGRLPSRAEPPNCEPGSFINSSKKVGKEKCSECPPGTYSDSVGARECKKCDLNFALAVETGMTECDLCDAGSRPVDGIFCSRKAKLTCPEKGPGSDICRQTTDSNPETFATIPAGVSVRYFLGKPEHFGSLTFIRKKDCCSKDVEDIKITFPNEGYCITDAESTENSTENYLRLSYPYCGYEEMKYFDVSSWRTNRSITFRDIEFEALKL